MAEGTSTIFGLMGDGNMYWMSALDKHGVKMMVDVDPIEVL